MIESGWQSALASALLVAAMLPAGAEAESPLSATAVSAAPATSPRAAALQVALAGEYGPGAPERRFYEDRGFRTVWLDEDGSPTAAARALLAWVGRADAHALPPARYDAAGLVAATSGSNPVAPGDAAGREVALTRLFLTFAHDISSGLLEPREVDREIDVSPRRPDPTLLLAGIAAAADPAAYLDTLVPASPDYRQLLALYAELRVTARSGDWGQPVASGDTLRPGDQDPRVAQIRARLQTLGDLGQPGQATAGMSGTRVAANEVATDAAPVPSGPASFDPVLEAAVRRFQERHGLSADGIVGPATLAAINATAAERASQVAVNLERLRWLNYGLGQHHVVINIADYSMTLMEGGAPRFRTRTVVGQAGQHRTPEFIDALEYIVVNPIWNVPFSIATEEILPLLRENPLYLQENNMDLVGSDLPATQIDWTKVTRASFPGRLKQRPGPDNALGDVKFLFPNQHSIYMHDTPSQRLFARDRRDFSHGCVRLADPHEFALLLLSLQDGVEDPAARFESLRARPGEQWVRIDHPIPVYLTYRTTWIDPDGQRQFRADVYRRDRRIAAALAVAGVAIGG